MDLQLNRRNFIKTTLSAFTGMTLGFSLKGKSFVAAATASSSNVTIWLNISEDNVITVVVPKAEMGQGVTTSLPMMLADELEADWDSIQVELVGEIDDYLISGMPITAGSTSIVTMYKPFRKVGAAAKEMLLSACAAK